MADHGGHAIASRAGHGVHAAAHPDAVHAQAAPRSGGLRSSPRRAAAGTGCGHCKARRRVRRDREGAARADDEPGRRRREPRARRRARRDLPRIRQGESRGIAQGRRRLPARGTQRRQRPPRPDRHPRCAQAVRPRSIRDHRLEGGHPARAQARPRSDDPHARSDAGRHPDARPRWRRKRRRRSGAWAAVGARAAGARAPVSRLRVSRSRRAPGGAARPCGPVAAREREKPAEAGFSSSAPSRADERIRTADPFITRRLNGSLPTAI